MNRKEIDYYQEIAHELVLLFESELEDDSYTVKPLIGEISSALRTLIANGYEAGELLRSYSMEVHRLHLDVSVLIEHKETGKFEVIIFEIKKVNGLGLNELSQLIGYCLVSKAKFGILVNVDKAVSSQFSIILDADKDLTEIIRITDGKKLSHQFGVMVWNSDTLKIEYTNSGSIKSIPQLVSLIVNSVS
ncbi:MAG: hypothetical protein MK052_03970 [Alphaproteobacteria bacterium]|nr:hypothetical protein [Alphaproteobacteria bacterium]